MRCAFALHLILAIESSDGPATSLEALLSTTTSFLLDCFVSSSIPPIWHCQMAEFYVSFNAGESYIGYGAAHSWRRVGVPPLGARGGADASLSFLRRGIRIERTPVPKDGSNARAAYERLSQQSCEWGGHAAQRLPYSRPIIATLHMEPIKQQGYGALEFRRTSTGAGTHPLPSYVLAIVCLVLGKDRTHGFLMCVCF